MPQTGQRSNELRDWGIVIGAGAVLGAVIIGAVTFATHIVGPLLFTHYGDFPALAALPKRAVNAKRVAGDPINIAIVASSDSELTAAFRAAHWVEAVPVTRASSIGIARSVLFNRPDSAAPVSPLFLFGRQQDHAFELEEGRSARRRDHVRLWRVAGVTYEGRPVWIGGASFDQRAGISHRGLHPTHHIDPDVDNERDRVAAFLGHSGQVAKEFHVTGLGVRANDHNAEGDRFDTDGEMTVLVVPPGNVPHAVPRMLPDPPLVRLKELVLARLHR